METREGFGEHGNVALFDDFPTVTTVTETLTARAGPNRAVVDVVLDELAFCMKTATRLGRVVRIGERWWGHPQTYGSRQMEVVDEYERTGVTADEFDLWAVLDPSDLIALVGLRTGIVPTVVESFHVHGIHFRTPPRELGPSAIILDELVAHPEALANHDHVFIAAERTGGGEGDAPPHLVCRDANDGWLVIELYVAAEDARSSPTISSTLDEFTAERAGPGQQVSGLVLTDGYSQMFVEQTMRDERVVHRNLRSLDLPVCRADHPEHRRRAVVQHRSSLAAEASAAGPYSPRTVRRARSCRHRPSSRWEDAAPPSAASCHRAGA